MARKLDQPPLPETGPAEVARGSASFIGCEDTKRNMETRSQALAAGRHDLRTTDYSGRCGSSG